MKSLFRNLMVAAAGLLAACSFMATEASAQSFPGMPSVGFHRNALKPVAVHDGTYVISAAADSSLVIAVDNDKMNDGANINVGRSSHQNNQKWNITSVGGGWYRIESVSSGKTLDVAGASKANSANVQQYSFHNGDNQLWRFEDAGNGNVYIRSKNGNYIDAASMNNSIKRGANIQMYSWNGRPNQMWKLKATVVESKKLSIKEATFNIASAANSNLMLDVSGDSRANGANVIVYSSNGNNNQKWKAIDLGNREYRFESISSGLVLGVERNRNGQGVNVNQQKWQRKDGQIWIIEDAGNGAVYIRSKLGYYLDADNSRGVRDNSNVQIYSLNRNNNQKWLISYTRPENDRFDHRDDRRDNDRFDNRNDHRGNDRNDHRGNDHRR